MVALIHEQDYDQAKDRSALCALTVAHQAVHAQPRFTATILMMASMHEVESLRVLLESALIQVQMPKAPQTLH
ncbi:hypothetical protein [Pseudomonas entomophila]|uniref:hypothetical protein n=1 Tax=Pseudomonas entomophila TaxID=312306 RepID=UPI001F029358|nr:hypothetical protein [Pseudomonas entomophila]MCG8295220.1 hypothetical protein [Pseudomonas entomophila]